MNIRPENITREIEAALDQILAALEDPVFMLDADHIVIANRSQGSYEFCPVNISEPGQARDLPAHAL